LDCGRSGLHLVRQGGQIATNLDARRRAIQNIFASALFQQLIDINYVELGDDGL
jgi:hypothetical protein